MITIMTIITKFSTGVDSLSFELYNSLSWLLM